MVNSKSAIKNNRGYKEGLCFLFISSDCQGELLFTITKCILIIVNTTESGPFLPKNSFTRTNGLNHNILFLKTQKLLFLTMVIWSSFVSLTWIGANIKTCLTWCDSTPYSLSWSKFRKCGVWPSKTCFKNQQEKCQQITLFSKLKILFNCMTLDWE